MNKILTSILLISIFAGATLPSVAQDQTNNASANISQSAAQLQGGSANSANISGIFGGSNTQGDTQNLAQNASISVCQGNIYDIIGIADNVTKGVCKDP